MRIRIGSFACLALLAPPAFADADQIGRIGPPPEWVELLEPDYEAPSPAGDEQRSTHHLLVDHQVDVRARGDEQFRRIAVRLVTDAGADDYSQLSFTANPAYERLTLHWLRVYRDGRVADRLPSARITVVPVESDLRERIYRGDLSVSVLVPDLRAGDVLDYAYTTDFLSPNFPEHFSVGMSIDWSVPVHRQRIRVRHLPGDPVRYRVQGGKAEPSVKLRDGRREIEFDWSDLPARRGEADLPDWYPHWAYVEFSDMADWGAVAAPTAAMYRAVEKPGPRTRAQVEALKAMPGTDADRALAALRMVQDDIQYASISIGPGSYRPSPPELVLERNFGDCKDKSLLLVSLLRALGVDASVALVNTRTGELLAEALPTPVAFDHAIVRARLGDDVLWLDPTVSRQGGTLAKTAQADFVNALVIDPATRGLEAIPRSRPDGSVKDVQLVFDLRAGADKPATLEVRTRFEGTAADSMRTAMSSRSVAERTADYVDYYASYYPGIQSAGSLAVEDDVDANVVVVKERYRLERGFRPRGGQTVFEVFPDELYAYADGTDTPNRTTPLAQAYPARVSQSFEIRLPEEWPARSASVTVDNPAFRYESNVRYRNQVLKIAYRFESLTDRVPVEGVRQYLADVQRMYDDLGYELTYDSLGSQLSSGIAPYPLVALLLGLAAGLWLAFRVTLRYDPEPRSIVEAEKPPVGISGWLLLVALNVIFMAAALVIFAQALLMFSFAATWDALPATAEESVASWARHGVAGLLFLAFLAIPSAIAIAWLFFRRRTSAPNLVVALFWGVAAFTTLAEQLTMRLVPFEEDSGVGPYAVLASDLLFLLLWTRYLQVSVRVAATFTRRRAPRSAVSAVPPPAGGLPAA